MVNITTIWSYLEPFLETREYLHLAEVSQRLHQPHSTVRQYLNALEQQGVLAKSVKGRLTLYKLNLSFPLLVDYLALAEKERLIMHCRTHTLIHELVSFLHAHLKEENKALIFGSAAINAKKAGDMDILVTGKIDQEPLLRFGDTFSLQIHLITVKRLGEVTPGLKEEIRKKHLIIQGSEEIIQLLP